MVVVLLRLAQKKKARAAFPSVIRVLLENYYFDLIKRRKIESVENLLGWRIDNNAGLHLFHQFFLQLLHILHAELLRQGFFQPSLIWD